MSHFPPGWQIKPLKEVATLQRGFDLPVNDRVEGSVPVFAANGPVGTHNVAKVNGPGVVTGRSGTLGKVHFVETDYWPLNTALWVKDFHGNDPNWVFRLLSWMKLENHTRGTGVPTLNRNLVHVVEVPLPPIEEQRRIAAILDKADAVRRKRKEAIALTEELLRSVFLDMFGDPIANPKGWEIVNLGSQVSELRYGTSVKCSDSNQHNDLPVLRIPNIVQEKIDWDDLKYVALEKKEIEKLILKSGDILFVRTNGNPEYIGRCAIFEDGFRDTLYASYLIRARLKKTAKILPSFLRDTISFPTYRSRLVREARTTAGNYNISTAGLSRLQLISPPIELQKKYLRLHEQISLSQCKYDSYSSADNKLFNSLLQRAFRGEL